MNTQSLTATIVVETQSDYGNRGITVNRSQRGLWVEGQDIVEWRLEAYPANCRVNLAVEITLGKWKVVDATFNKESRHLAHLYRPLANPPFETDQGVDVTINTPFEQEAPVTSVMSGYYIAPEARLIFSTAKKMLTDNPERSVKVMMVGPTGCGKSTLPRLFAEVTGMTYHRMDCAKLRDPEEWFGYREAQAGSTVFVRSRFAQLMEEGNCVLLLDEFNRLEPWLHNTIFPLLDDEQRTLVHDEEFVVGPNVLFVGTINLGHRYTGTFQLDAALYNRFDMLVEVGHMEHAQEIDVLIQRTGVDRSSADLVVRMANNLRGTDIECSTRDTLRLAYLIVSGMTVRQAFETVIVRRIPKDGTNNQRKLVVDRINGELGTFQVSAIQDDVFSASLPLPNKVATQTNRKSFTLEMKKSVDAVSVGMPAVVKVLRHLPLLKSPALNTREEQFYVEELRKGRQVTISLSEIPKDYESLVEQLTLAGVVGKFVTL